MFAVGDGQFAFGILSGDRAALELDDAIIVEALHPRCRVVGLVLCPEHSHNDSICHTIPPGKGVVTEAVVVTCHNRTRIGYGQDEYTESCVGCLLRERRASIYQMAGMRPIRWAERRCLEGELPRDADGDGPESPTPAGCPYLYAFPGQRLVKHVA